MSLSSNSLGDFCTLDQSSLGNFCTTDQSSSEEPSDIALDRLDNCRALDLRRDLPLWREQSLDVARSSLQSRLLPFLPLALGPLHEPLREREPLLGCDQLREREQLRKDWPRSRGGLDDGLPFVFLPRDGALASPPTTNSRTCCTSEVVNSSLGLLVFLVLIVHAVVFDQGEMGGRLKETFMGLLHVALRAVSSCCCR